MEQTKDLYKDLVCVFDKLILPTHASCHVQYALFYLCSFRLVSTRNSVHPCDFIVVAFYRTVEWVTGLIGCVFDPSLRLWQRRFWNTCGGYCRARLTRQYCANLPLATWVASWPVPASCPSRESHPLSS